MHYASNVTTAVSADWVPGPYQGTWTYDAYAALPDDGQRYEIVQGVLVMTPAPETACSLKNYAANDCAGNTFYQVNNL